MKKLLLILLCLPMIGFGQGWETTFGGASADVGESVQQTTDGGYIITGLTHSYGNGYGYSDVYLLKTDVYGVEQWSQTLGGTNYEAGYSIQQTTDGGYIITGGKGGGNGNSEDVYLIKTDVNGVELWSQTFGGTGEDYCFSVQQTTDGGYVITGDTDSYGNGSYDVYLIKTDVNGVELWSQTFGGPYYDEGKSVQQTTDGGYIITGITGEWGFGNVYLIKTDGSGIEQWSQTFGASTVNDWGQSVQQTTDGGYIITGGTGGIGGASLNSEDVYLIKTDGSGIEQWSQTFGGTGSGAGGSVQQTTDGGYIITGYTTSFVNGSRDVYLIKTDGSGIEQWSQTFGGTDDDEGKSVQQTTDGGYIITGTTGGWGFSNVYLIKTDANGNATSTFNIPALNANRKLENTFDVLGKQTKPQPNTPFIEIYDDGTVEKRIVIE